MNVKKFYASTTREALRQVRDALGADAIILSNRQVAGGVEIMAVADMDVSSLTGTPAAPSPSVPEPKPVQPELQLQHPAPAAAPPKPIEVQEEVGPDNVVADIAREIKFLRGMLEGQLAGLAWGDLQRRDPGKVEILRTLLTAGISPMLSRQLLDRMPPDLDYAKGIRWIKAALLKNLQVVPPANGIVERGGVYALIGPTGVGKTTTVAKIAALSTLRHGPARVALLTTDSYRIGAHEQLRIYGKILGVPVHAIKDENDFQFTLSDLQNKHLVLIDTVGMSQRDRRVAEQVALLSGAARPIRRLLLLSATAQGSTLEDVIRSYTSGAGAANGDAPRLDGCILTKIDETASLGTAIDAVVRHRLPLHFITNGQRVPEDLHPANPMYLLDRVFKVPAEASPFVLKDNEFPLLMTGDAGASDTPPAGEGRRDAGGLRD